MPPRGHRYGRQTRHTPPTLMSVREACAVLERDKKTVIRWARDTSIPLEIATKHDGKNGAIFFDSAQVHKLAQQLHANETDPEAS